MFSQFSVSFLSLPPTPFLSPMSLSLSPSLLLTCAHMHVLVHTHTQTHTHTRSLTQAPGCPKLSVLSFMGGFHGRTIGRIHVYTNILPYWVIIIIERVHTIAVHLHSSDLEICM